MSMIGIYSGCSLPMQTSSWAEAESGGAPHNSDQLPLQQVHI